MIEKVLAFVKNNLRFFAALNLIIIIATVVFSAVKGGFDGAATTISGFAAAFMLGYFGVFGRYAKRTADTLKKLTIIAFLLAIIVAVICIAFIKFSLLQYLTKAIAVCLGFIASAIANLDDLKE